MRSSVISLYSLYAFDSAGWRYAKNTVESLMSSRVELQTNPPDGLFLEYRKLTLSLE